MPSSAYAEASFNVRDDLSKQTSEAMAQTSLRRPRFAYGLSTQNR